MTYDLSLSERNDAADVRRSALAIMLDAFTEASLDGLPEDSVSQAALFMALQKLVSCYGEDAVATFAERLPERVRHGEFSLTIRQ